MPYEDRNTIAQDSHSRFIFCCDSPVPQSSGLAFRCDCGGCFLLARRWCPLYGSARINDTRNAAGEHRGQAFCPTTGDWIKNLEFRLRMDDIASEVIRVTKDVEHHQAEPAEFIGATTKESSQPHLARPAPATEIIRAMDLKRLLQIGKAWNHKGMGMRDFGRRVVRVARGVMSKVLQISMLHDSDFARNNEHGGFGGPNAEYGRRKNMQDMLDRN
jgi:hypothetical protein